MNAVPASIRAALEPQVNLLPPEVEARRARGRRKGMVAVGFGAFVLLLGFAVYWAGSQDAAAQADLKTAVADGEQLKLKIAEYDYILVMEAELKNARDARTYVGSTEIDVDALLGDIAAALPADAKLESITWSVLSITEPAPAPVEGVAAPPIGTLTITGQTVTYISGADLEERLNAVPGLSGARVSAQTKQGIGAEAYYAFDSTAEVNALALSGRFSAAWLEQDAVWQALAAMNARWEAAWATVTAAVDEDAAFDARVEAEEAFTLVDDDLDIILGLYLLKLEAEQEVLLQQQAVEYGGEGAAADLATAEASVAAITPILNTLAAAVNVWDDDATSLATINDRIAAAEEYVDVCQTRVSISEDAVAEGVEGAETALAVAQIGLLRAEFGLRLEQSFLADAETVEAASRAALDAALLQAEIAFPEISVREGA